MEMEKIDIEKAEFQNGADCYKAIIEIHGKQIVYMRKKIPEQLENLTIWQTVNAVLDNWDISFNVVDDLLKTFGFTVEKEKVIEYYPNYIADRDIYRILIAEENFPMLDQYTLRRVITDVRRSTDTLVGKSDVDEMVADVLKECDKVWENRNK